VTLNSSGPISLGGSTAGQSIALELGLGATAQISLNDAAVRTLAGKPSGVITMPTDFYGKANRTITLPANQTVSDSGPGGASASLQLNFDGNRYENTLSGGTVNDGAWCAPAGQVSTVQMRATVTSGSLTSGTTGSWISATQSWSLTKATPGTFTCVFTLEVRDSTTLTVLATETVTLQVTVI
jgi:hypothetical protein